MDVKCTSSGAKAPIQRVLNVGAKAPTPEKATAAPRKTGSGEVSFRALNKSNTKRIEGNFGEVWQCRCGVEEG